MVRAIIIGRMGNQMFQYAHAKNVAKKYNKELHLYFYKVDNQLKSFNTGEYIEDKKLSIPFYQILFLFFFLVIRKICCRNDRYKQQKLERKYSKLLANVGILFNTVGYTKEPVIKRKNILVVGYYESTKYFKEIEMKIRKEFSVHISIPEKYRKLYDSVNKQNSVAVSIRRGDFVKLNNVVCTKEYFEKAMHYIYEHVKNPKYYIFSDDVEWVKENMNFPKDSWFEENDMPLYEVMRLRMNCKHFIVSNSTFSWWGAYLSDNENKIVVVPKIWRYFKAEINIVEDGWIKIDNS